MDGRLGMNAEQSANSRDGDVGYVSTSFTPADWWLRAIGEERDRWLLWVPVGIGMGVLIYFHLPVEPGALGHSGACAPRDHSTRRNSPSFSCDFHRTIDLCAH